MSLDQIMIPRKFATSGMGIYMFGLMKIKGSRVKNIGRSVRRCDAKVHEGKQKNYQEE
jgi:hypothetical protein